MRGGKESSPMTEGEVEVRYLLSQPIRFGIVDLIRREGKKYIAEISKELGINRKIISYHLRALEKEKLIKTNLTTKLPATGNPVLVRYVELTELTVKILEKHSL